jgi:hypothetical protein
MPRHFVLYHLQENRIETLVSQFVVDEIILFAAGVMPVLKRYHFMHRPRRDHSLKVHH